MRPQSGPIHYRGVGPLGPLTRSDSGVTRAAWLALKFIALFVPPLYAVAGGLGLLRPERRHSGGGIHRAADTPSSHGGHRNARPYSTPMPAACFRVHFGAGMYGSKAVLDHRATHQSRLSRLPRPGRNIAQAYPFPRRPNCRPASAAAGVRAVASSFERWARRPVRDGGDAGGAIVRDKGSVGLIGAVTRYDNDQSSKNVEISARAR